MSGKLCAVWSGEGFGKNGAIWKRRFNAVYTFRWIFANWHGNFLAENQFSVPEALE